MTADRGALNPVPPRDGATGRDAGVQDASGILQTLGTGVLTVSPAGIVLFANAALERMLGLRAGELRGRPLWQALPALANAHEAGLVRATMEDGRTREWRSELRDERRSGIYDIRATRDRAGALLLEITDAAAAARLEQQHGRLLESVGEALAVLGSDWRVTFWNPAAERMTGVSRESVVGRRLWERFPGIARGPLYRMFRDAIDRGVTCEVRNWHYKGDTTGGARGSYDVRAHPLEGGGLLVLFVEVTAQMRRERELLERSGENDWLRELLRKLAGVAESEELLALLCESAREHCAATGAAVGEVHDGECDVVAATGRTVAEVGTHFPLAGTLAEQAIGTRVPSSSADYERDFPDSWLHAHVPRIGPSLIAPLIAHDDVLGFVIVTREPGAAPFSAAEERRLGVIADHAALVMRKARLLEEAQQANEAKAAFLATMSHELRTPLTALTGYGELLVDEIMGPLSAQQQDIVERMRSVTHHLAGMIEEVLAYASLEAGREQARPREVRVREVVDAAMAVIAPLAAQKGLALEVELPDVLPPLQTDPDKLRQILVNLLGNAVKFTDRGSVALRVATDADGIVFTVRDTGIGIPATHLARLFQPFGQLDAGLTRRHGGTGLGLYISARLAALLGGGIGVESELGAGSEFTVRLPLGR